MVAETTLCIEEGADWRLFFYTHITQVQKTYTGQT